MCGISGIIAQKPLDSSFIKRMNDLVEHRGPDDHGVESFLDGMLWLGHRRLSVLDLTPAAHQPMSYLNGRYWIVYNGEIYNHLELREKLEAAGHRFASHSDTEVILAAYAEWGTECLSRFDGMWAFLLYDVQAKTLFAARDRFGIKPLYYWISPEGILAFASEIKQFTALPGWRARINGQRAYDFLNWSITDHTSETLFSGVFQLRGGQALLLDEEGLYNVGRQNKALPIWQWYSLSPQPYDGRPLADSASTFRELLTDAVRLHLRADVPVGSCLSGGLDSSSIVCLVAQLLREQGAASLQKTFSAGFDIEKFDERPYINEVARRTGVDAHYTSPALNGLFDTLGNLTWHQDEPFASTSIYAQWHVFKLAADNGVKVMLDGQGADEVNAGYHGFFGPYYASLFRQMRWDTLVSEVRVGRKLHGYSAFTAAMRIANVLLPEAVCDFLRTKVGKADCLPHWLNMEKLGANPANPFGARTDSVQSLSLAQLTSTNLPMLLHWEDRNSMAHGVEARVPFLDYKLVEFVLGLPDNFKLSDGLTKLVLREGMKGILPEAIYRRTDKLGFVTPEEVWLRDEGRQEFRAALQDAIDASNGILKDEVRAIFDDMVHGRRPFSFLAWRLISFGKWLNVFNVKV